MKEKMSRTDLINLFIRKRKYTRYLEIGTQFGSNLHAVQCAVKVGVDPDPAAVATVRMASDDYFLAYPNDHFDIVFIDGLHHADQVQRDIEHSLAVLNKGGVILCHDMLPKSEEGQRVPRETKVWYGDCWKAFVRLRRRSDLTMYCVAVCTGIAVIYPGKQTPLHVAEADLTYANWLVHKQAWMRIRSMP